MLKWVAAIAIATCLTLQGPLSVLAQSQETGTIIVTVTDAATGKPIDNADVFLLGGDTPQNSLTNAKGLLIFEGVQPASYRVTVEADGYKASASTDVEVAEGQRVDVAVKMAPQALIKTIAAVVAHSTTSVSVETIDQNSAQLKVSQSLNDALSKIAGVTVDTNLYGADSAFNISLRGADASRTAFSIDGLHVAGAGSQGLGGFQDLFSGGSVNFDPTAMSSAGSVNFVTMQPTKIWSYSFTGLAGNYSNTLGMWSITGGAGKAAFALEHTAGGQDYPLSGMYYADQSGSSYTHQGGYDRIANLLKAALTLSPVTNLKYTLMTGRNRYAFLCSDDTTLLPCSMGQGNISQGTQSLNSLALSSLAGHVQFNLSASRWYFQGTESAPNRAINGVPVPYYATNSFPSDFYNANVSSTARRHTLSAGAYENVNHLNSSSTFNASQIVTDSQIQRSGNMWISDRVKANDKLALNYTISQASGTGAGTSLEFYQNLTWQPKRVDVFQAGLGIGSAEPAWGSGGTISDAASGQYDCHNGSVYVYAPGDRAVKQSSLYYSLGWRHTMKNGFISASFYRTDSGGQSLYAGVPFASEPPSLFPDGPAAYLGQIENVWAQPTVCGSTPFDPSRVYVSQDITGIDQIQQGLDLSAQIPLGRNVVALPRYAVTNAYISTLDPRLAVPGSYYAAGAQLPHTPLHTAGITLDGHLTHSSLEWLADADYTSINNGNNLPAHTIYNAGLLWSTPHGTIRLLESNIFGTGTGLFTTYEGVDPMPLQGGGTFAYATTPLQPRSFTIEYQVRWHEHQSPAKKKGGNAKP